MDDFSLNGNPKLLLVMGHSASARPAALNCTDDGYRNSEGLSLAIVKGMKTLFEFIVLELELLIARRCRQDARGIR